MCEYQANAAAEACAANAEHWMPNKEVYVGSDKEVYEGFVEEETTAASGRFRRSFSEGNEEDREAIQ